MLVGSLSSNAYGEARSTKDADFVVQLNLEKRDQILKQLPEAFEIDHQISFETITGHTRQILKIPSIPFEIELFDLSDEPFDQSRFERRIETRMGNHVVWLPTPEDVILQKLRWASLANRPKDLLDAIGIVRVRKERLDWRYINRWAADLQIGTKLAELNAASEDF
ncbi:MAG: nucleotidyl transferase AbiEii/AbiGii toxin family protein [Verrucomicrobiota bacterium]